jgi:hypothetical protein
MPALRHNTILPESTIAFAERNCLKCGNGFVIEDNVVAKRLPSKKKPASEHVGQHKHR